MLKKFGLSALNSVFTLSEKWWGQLIIVAAPVLIIFIAVPIMGKALFQGDLLTAGWPATVFYGQAIKQGRLILWDANTLSGSPVFLVASEFFSPLNFLSHKLFNNYLDSHHWLLAFNWILAGFLVVRLLKKFNVSNLAAIVGGLSYVISIRNIEFSIVNAYVLLPLLFLVIACNYKKNHWWLTVLGGLIIGEAYFIAHPNWLVMVLTGVFIFSVGVVWINFGRISDYVKNIVNYIVMVVIGTVIGLVYLAPIYMLTQFSSRQGGMSYNDAAVGPLNLVDAFGFIFPDLNPPFIAVSAVLYIGIFGFIFLLVSVFVKKRPVRFFLFLFVSCLIIAVPYSPVFWILNKLPIYQYFRQSSRWMFLGTFSASLAVAFGVDQFLSASFFRIRKNIIVFVKWLVFLLLGLSLAVNLILFFWGDTMLNFFKKYFLLEYYPNTTRLPIEHYYKIIDKLFSQAIGVFSFENFRFVMPLIVLAIACLLLQYFHKHLEQAKYFSSSVVLVILFSMILTMPVNSAYISVIDRSVLLEYQPQVAQFISQNPGRIFSFMPGFTEWEKLVVPHNPSQEDRFIFESEILMPRVNEFYNIPSADGYDNLMSKKYGAIISLIGSDRAVAGANESLVNLKIPIEDKIELFNRRHNLLDMLGIKYIVSGYDLKSKDLQKVFETRATKYQIPIYVYENIEYSLLFFLAKNVQYINPTDDNYQIIVDNENNFNNITFIECSDCKIVDSDGGEVETMEHNHGHVKLKTHVSSETWLIFNENSFPGWRATIDNKKAKIYTANYLFQAILVPTGEHEIIFDYRYAEIVKSLFRK